MTSCFGHAYWGTFSFKTFLISLWTIVLTGFNSFSFSSNYTPNILLEDYPSTTKSPDLELTIGTEIKCKNILKSTTNHRQAKFLGSIQLRDNCFLNIINNGQVPMSSNAPMASTKNRWNGTITGVRSENNLKNDTVYGRINFFYIS